MPLSFKNDKGKLVGFDVELMHMLARELNVELAFIPWSYETSLKRMENEAFDVAIGGLIVTPARLAIMNFSNPYIDMTTAIVVKDHERHKYKNWSTIDKDRMIRLGVVGKGRVQDLKSYLPNTDIVAINSYREFFTRNPNSLDGLVISAEAGSAWTILYPAYCVVVPEPHLKAHAALAILVDDPEFEEFLNDRLQIKKTRGINRNLYEKWILGKKEEDKKQRWSIGRNVLNLWE
jgi:ABC-type amino acid transport substrate-binding protein